MSLCVVLQEHIYSNVSVAVAAAQLVQPLQLHRAFAVNWWGFGSSGAWAARRFEVRWGTISRSTPEQIFILLA